MQYELQIFQDAERREFRTLEIDGEPWFVLADVCAALDLKPNNGSYYKHAERLDPDEKGTVASTALKRSTSTLGGEVEPRGARNYIIINESGLYSLILRSEKPEAKRFKKWVTSEVLPSLRKAGSYATGGKPVSAEWQPFHDRINAAWGAVPEGYFSIFRETVEFVGQLITNGVQVDHRIVPDISLGIAWGKHWQENGYGHEYGERTSYPHSYPASFPQSRSNPQWAYAYPEDALSVFRRWLRNTYIKGELPRYLLGQAAKGKVPRPLVEATLVAVGALPAATRPPLKLPS